MEAYISGNSYVKLDLYNQVNIELSSSLVEILDNGANETIKSNARKLLYYCDLLKQKINILDGVMKNLDSYKLLLYRFDVISGGEQTYIQTLNTDQKISYEFLCETEDFIENSYITLLNEFI